MGSSVWLIADDGSAGERFNLSRNKTLRTLETNADSIVHASDAASIFFSKRCFPPSHPLCPWTSLSSTAMWTLTFLCRLGQSLNMHPQGEVPSALQTTESDSRCSVRCMGLGSFGWFFVQMFQIALQSVPCEYSSALWRRRGRVGDWITSCTSR